MLGQNFFFLPSPNRPQLPSRPKTFLFPFLFFLFFTIFEIIFSKKYIFWLKTFQKVYVENSKDFYGDRRVKLDQVKSLKRFDLKECRNFIKIWTKKKLKKKIWLTDPTLHRACEGKKKKKIGALSSIHVQKNELLVLSFLLYKTYDYVSYLFTFRFELTSSKDLFLCIWYWFWFFENQEAHVSLVLIINLYIQI